MKKYQQYEATNPIFTIWIGNQTAQKLDVFTSDLRNLMKKWLFKKETIWLQSTPNDMIVAMFLADKDGANCTYNKKDFPELSRLLSLDIKKHLAS